jgi:2-C-methyl-D-erythritol 2,4-cyclodiphosphate synthase
MRIGMGYDIHRLAPGRRLVLGGVEIPHPLGLMGHSDADALIHAVCDALLGAAGLGDIGTHFPDTDPAYRDIDSGRLLVRCREMVEKRGYSVVNADVTVFAEAPRISPHREAMGRNLARLLAIDPERVNVKATTAEGLGPVGRGEGIAALCVLLID